MLPMHDAIVGNMSMDFWYFPSALIHERKLTESEKHPRLTVQL